MTISGPRTAASIHVVNVDQATAWDARIRPRAVLPPASRGASHSSDLLMACQAMNPSGVLTSWSTTAA